MSSTFKRNEDLPEIPGWWILDQQGYSEFIREVETYLAKKNVPFTLIDGVLHIGENNAEFGHQLGLQNLAQKCWQHKPESYQAIISEHFDSVLKANAFKPFFDTIVHSFDKVKQYIGVRLYSEEYLALLEKDLWILKNFCGDIYAALVFDLPDSISIVTREEADKWSKTPEELFKLGVQNIKSKYPVDIIPQQSNDLKFWLVQSDHYFTANVVFDLENIQQLIGCGGALVGIPHRHAVIIYPIENMQVIMAMSHLFPVVFKMYEEGPGSISSKFFWYHNDVFEDLAYKIENNTLRFLPLDSFDEMLETLAE